LLKAVDPGASRFIGVKDELGVCDGIGATVFVIAVTRFAVDGLLSDASLTGGINELSAATGFGPTSDTAVARLSVAGAK
jgi:hypothetical protein